MNRQILGVEKAVENEDDMIPNMVDAFETVPKGLEERLDEWEIRGNIRTIQMTALLRPARIVKRVLLA